MIFEAQFLKLQFIFVLIFLDLQVKILSFIQCLPCQMQKVPLLLYKIFDDIQFVHLLYWVAVNFIDFLLFDTIQNRVGELLGNIRFQERPNRSCWDNHIRQYIFAQHLREVNRFVVELRFAFFERRKSSAKMS